MFYSHEVLTSGKYGVATVWLVATLGSKSSLKRINRKQILDVDVAKACQTIVDPIAPMALRLQSNLLYGVSRVYLQQCGYVLSDAQSAHNTMLMLLRAGKGDELDPGAGKARPEQLVLQDDPSFLPDFALPPPELLADVDLGLDLDITRSGDSQSLTPFGSQQFRSSSQAGTLVGLVIPSSSSPPPGSFRLHGDTDAVEHTGLVGAEDDTQLGEPDFAFDENGELFQGPSIHGITATPTARSGAAMRSDVGADAKVRREHEEGRMSDAQLPGNDVDMDIDLPILGDDLPEGEAFPTARHDDDHIEVIQSTSTVSAPMRKKRRTARVLPIDSRMELRHKDLADWNADYLQNMDAIIKAKKHARIAQQAKKNAEYFVWGRGLGGVAQHYANGTGPNPFEMFIGDNLFELATGISRKKGTKHSRDSGIDEATQNEARRVRQRTSEREEEMGRGDEDEGFFQPGGDEVEMPREAATALDDQQIFSSMPWNMSASKHGSSAVPRSARLGMTDQARPGSRPGSRMVSASPLLGRSQALGLEALRSLESDGDVALSGDEFAGPGPSSPPTVVPSPVKPSGRINEALSAEDANFLDFVNDAIVEKRDRAQANLNHRTDVAQATEIDIVTFEELLPPVENNKMVACQGLMMVLLLGTKGMLDVQQLGDFGDINLKLTLQAKASQVVEISDDEVSDSDDNQSDGDVDMSQEEVAEEVGEGHFDEQFAAGHAAQEQRDDDDSLYDN